jgi:hypothetical protein
LAPAGRTGKLSAEFLRPKSPNNKYVTFGTEASLRERRAASRTLRKSFRAREQPNFGVQCTTLDAATIQEVVKAADNQLASSTCARALKILAEPLPDTEIARADTLAGPIAVLRVRADKGYAFYHGNDGRDHLMPLTKEEGRWKVGALLTIELDPEPPPPEAPSLLDRRHKPKALDGTLPKHHLRRSRR